MISLLPSSPPAETYGAYAILALISDPAAAKSRLDALVAASNVNAATLEAAQKAQAKAADDQARADATLGEATKAANDLLADNKAKAIELAKKEQELTSRAQWQTDREAAFAANSSAASSALDARENAVATRESAAKALADKATSDANVAAILRAELERKLNAFKSLAS